MNNFPEIQEKALSFNHNLYYDYKSSPEVTEQQEDFLNLSLENGWINAVDTEFGNKVFRKYIASKDRLTTLDVIPFESGQNILEIGPGYGQMTGAIARKVATLDIIEADAVQARFCRIRMDQEGVGNVRVIAGGADAELPYADRSFDGVVMNLVLEWCGVRSQLPHEQVQSAYLAEIARVLRPGGFLFLSTKNRFSLRLLAGGRDEHMANNRFGSALPRVIGNALMSGERPRGYLHSFSALHRKIEDMGFRIETPYWAVPDMRWPTRYIPFEKAAVREAQRDSTLRLGGRRLHHLIKMLPATWVKHVAPGLVFLARRLPA